MFRKRVDPLVGTLFFYWTKNVAYEVTLVVSMYLVQCSNYSGLTMESCVGEVFLVLGRPHEWACTIIPSVCLLSLASFSLFFLIPACSYLAYPDDILYVCVCVIVVYLAKWSGSASWTGDYVKKVVHLNQIKTGQFYFISFWTQEKAAIFMETIEWTSAHLVQPTKMTQFPVDHTCIWTKLWSGKIYSNDFFSFAAVKTGTKCRFWSMVMTFYNQSTRRRDELRLYRLFFYLCMYIFIYVLASHSL